MDLHGENIARLEERMDRVEEGVANFRRFQLENSAFIAEYRNDKKYADALDKRRARLHYWWLGLLSAIITTGFGILLSQFLSIKQEHHLGSAITRTNDAPQISVGQ